MNCRKRIFLTCTGVILTGFILFSQSQYVTAPLPFNTSAKELAPAFYQNGLVFCSDRRSDVLLSYTDLSNNPLTNLYFSDQRRSGKFENPHLMAKELTTYMFEGPSTFSSDGKKIYFTRSIDVSLSLRNRQRADTTFGIFSAELNNGQWTNLSQFRFNNTAYNTGYPYLTDDGKKLFFCSNAPGGFGGYDIYVSELKNGQWGQPVNLGNQVNTSENEVFPFLHPSGRLYFASRGHHQGRDLDIFYTVNMEGDWQIPVPLEAPVNSKFNDYGLIMNTATDTAYYVSDRDGSADIYTATSTLPTFKTCAEQEENDYCYVFYEPNNNEIDTTAFAYEWDLGDGTKIRDLKAEHCFSAPGTYKVQLNLVDKLTHEVLLAQAIYDFDVEQIEQAYISAPDTIIAGVPVTFDGNETHLKDFTIDAYTWDFGDGYRSSGSRTEHRFNFPGSYELILGVTDKPEDKKSEERKTCVTRRIVVISNKN